MPISMGTSPLPGRGIFFGLKIYIEERQAESFPVFVLGS
jgi:hypothetical protein